MEGDVHVRPNPEQQNRLENWVEFQDYQLRIHEALDKERDNVKKDWDVARRKAEGAENEDEDTEDEDVDADFQYMLDVAERKLDQHKNLLLWIEQERLVMVAMHRSLVRPSVEEDRDDQNSALEVVRRLSRRKKRPKADTVLGDVRISKPERRKQTIPRQKRIVPEAQPAIKDAIGDSDQPQSSVSRNPNSREPRSAKKETALRQFRPQRVSKAKQFANASAKSLSQRHRSAGLGKNKLQIEPNLSVCGSHNGHRLRLL